MAAATRGARAAAANANPPPPVFIYSAPSDKMDSRVADKISKIPALNHQNCATWLYNLRIAINQSGSWTVVFRKDADGNYLGRPRVPADAAHYDEHNRKVAMWVFEAAGAANESLIDSFSDDGDGFGMVQALQNHYASSNASARYQALVSLLTMTRQTDEDFIKFLERLQLQLAEHRRLRPDAWNTVIFDDELVMTMLLLSIPENHPVRTSLMSKDDLNLVNVRDTIHFHTATTTASLVTTTSASSAPESASLVLTPVTGKDSKCWFCNLPGHHFRECKRMLRAKDECQRELAIRDTNSNRGQNRGRGSNRGYSHQRGTTRHQANLVHNADVEHAETTPAPPDV